MAEAWLDRAWLSWASAALCLASKKPASNKGCNSPPAMFQSSELGLTRLPKASVE